MDGTAVWIVGEIVGAIAEVFIPDPTPRQEPEPVKVERPAEQPAEYEPPSE